MVKIRLRRMGAKKKPFYRIVIADSRSSRDGRFIELVGTYDPNPDPPVVKVNSERIQYWLDNGARPSDTTRGLLKVVGFLGGVTKKVEKKAEPKKKATKAVKAEEAKAAASKAAAKVKKPAAEAPAEEPVAAAPAEEPVVEAPVEEPAAEVPAEAPAEEPAAEALAEEPVAEAPAEEPAAAESPAEEPAVVKPRRKRSNSSK